MQNQDFDCFVGGSPYLDEESHDPNPRETTRLFNPDQFDFKLQNIQDPFLSFDSPDQEFESQQNYPPQYNTYQMRQESSEGTYNQGSFSGESPNSEYSTPEGPGISKKTKIIQKCAQAKKRTKERKGEEWIKDVDEKYIPPEFYDPKTSEKERKRIVQKIRNRVSAQTSRDKKKEYVKILEDERDRYARENDRFMAENEEYRRITKKMTAEIEDYKRKIAEFECPKCGHGSPSPTYFPSTDASEGNESPVTRGSRGFIGSKFSMALLTLLGVVGVCLMDPFGGTVGTNKGAMGTRNLMATGTNITLAKTSAIQNNNNNIVMHPRLYDGVFSYHLIGTARENFNEHHEETYSSSTQRLFITDKENKTKEIQEDFRKTQLGYLATSQTQFLPKTNLITADSVRIIESFPDDIEDSITSTLFCPFAVEFYEPNGEMNPKGFELQTATNLEHSQYIQILIPKKNIKRGLLDENFDINSGPVGLDEDEGKMLELWVKPFFIRELGAANSKF